MALNIELKRSGVPGKVPTTSSLELGQIALNTYDGKAFMKKSGSLGEEIIEIGGGGGINAIYIADEGILQGTASYFNFTGSGVTATVTNNTASIYVPGNTGSQGVQGIQGIQGASGSQGVQGIQGLQGVQGVQGTQGVNGSSNSFFNYKAKTTSTSGDPLSGYLLWNNVTQSLATQINISEVDGLGDNVDVFLSNITSGSVITIQDKTSHTNYQTWTVGTSTDNTTYWSFPAALVTSSYSFSNDQEVLFIIVTKPAGLQGTQGIQGIQGIQGASGSQGIQGTQGIQGIQGASGSQGVQGIQGASGSRGVQGIQGIQGASGSQGVQGIQGIQGASGSQGIQGILGIQGASGSQGVQGIQGIQGASGSQGIQGASGSQGVQGIQGASGSQGVQGILGIQGASGSQGVQGIQGIQGASGSQGIQGILGIQGASGSQGVQGIQGIQGASGSQGIQGASGSQGIQGIQGASGSQGIQGIQGASGSQGVQGIQGIQGASGSQGIQGIQGASGSQGVQGIQGASGSQGIQGIQGASGSQGIQGIQGASGSQGIQGASGSQGVQGILGIQGASGSQGVQGIQGASGSQGILGIQGASGSQGVQGILGIQGASGSQGVQGIQGASGSQGVQGIQGASGSQGVQGILGIQGASGSQGVQGILGIQGASGSQGIQGTQGTQGILGTQGASGSQGVQGILGTQGASGSQGIQGTQGTQGIQGAAVSVSGTTNYVTKFTSATTIGNTGAPIFDDGTDVGIGTTTPGSKLNVFGNLRVGGSTTSNELRFYGLTGDGAGSYNHTGVLERLWGAGDQSELFLYKGNDPDGCTNCEDQVRIASAGRLVFHSVNDYYTLDAYLTAFPFNRTGSMYLNGNNMFVPNGNVGISTTTATQKLEVLGNALIGPTNGKMFIGDVGHGITYPALAHQDYATTTGYALLAPSDGYLFLNKRNVASTYIGFRRNNTDLMVLNNDGNLGIGVTNPGYKLDVRDVAQFGGDSGRPTIIGGSSGTNYIKASTGGWAFSWSAQGSSGTDRGGYGWYGGADSLTYYWIGPSFTSPHITILNDGNVGIGTTSPSSKFVVNNSGATGDAFYVNTGNSGTNTLFEHTGASSPVPFRLRKSGYSGAALNYGLLYLSMNDNTVGNGGALYFTLNDSAGNEHEYGGIGAVIASNTNGAENGHLYFMTSDSGTTRSEKMRILSGGNVGIGTTAPGSRLEVFSSTGAAAFGNGINIVTSPGTFTTGHGGILQFQNEDVITAGIRGVRDPGSWASSLLFYTHTSGVGNTFDTTFTEKMRINDGGNVGIGTTSPSQKLEVAGAINVPAGTYYKSGNVNIISSDGTSNYINIGAVLYFQDGATVRAVMNSAGNLGIGITAPQAPLHVIAASSADNALIQEWSYTAGNADVYSLMLKQTVTSGVVRYNFSMVNNSTAYNDVLVLDRGNVGIGTTNPGNPLHVGGGSTSANLLRMHIGYDTSRTTRGGINWFDGADITGRISTEYDGTMVSMVFGSLYNSGYNSNSLMIIRGNGNVGIGTTSPSEKLHVVSGCIFIDGEGGGLIVDTTSKRVGFMKYGGHEGVISRVAGQDFGIVRVGTSDIKNVTGLTYDVYVGNDGNVGIGTTTVSYDLDVSGTIRASADVIAYSDARVKTNVITIENALEKIKALRGVSYTRTDTKDKSEKIGVIAQEVLKVLPQVVQQDNQGNYSVAYGNMVGVLIEAIKEQQQQIDELKYLLSQK